MNDYEQKAKDFNEKHMESLIKWLLDEVMSSGGDGDGIWYAQNHSIDDIKKFIEDRNLLPKYWIMKEVNGRLELGENQESLTITNNEEDMNNKPIWQQVSITW